MNDCDRREKARRLERAAKARLWALEADLLDKAGTLTERIEDRIVHMERNWWNFDTQGVPLIDCPVCHARVPRPAQWRPGCYGRTCPSCRLPLAVLVGRKAEDPPGALCAIRILWRDDDVPAWSPWRNHGLGRKEADDARAS
jgi:hypothetical protein